MTMSKEFFTIKEAVENIIEAIKEEWTEEIEDLHHVTFNENYYIIGSGAAKQALKEYGVFEAIEKIQDYEKEHFGEIHTNLSDPEKVANMLWYVIGDEILQEVVLHDYDLQDEESKKDLINALKEYVKNN